jgi:phosphate transport system protein
MVRTSRRVGRSDSSVALGSLPLGGEPAGIGTLPGDIVDERSVRRPLRQSFHRDLDDVRGTVARLTADVAADIERATEILLTEDLDGVGRIAAADLDHHTTCVAVEERCYRLLALQAPVACDLRAVIAALWIVAEVGRAGELACNVGKTVRHVHGPALPPPIRELVVDMALRSAALLRGAGEAYLHGDAGATAEIRAGGLDDDEAFDRLRRQSQTENRKLRDIATDIVDQARNAARP